MRHYRGVFSEEYEHPESKLDEKSKLAMAMWAWKTEEDPCFKYLVDWIQNTEGNAAIKRGNPTPETILYSRAILSSMILLKREIGRLSAQYKELLAKKDDEFNSFQNE